MHASCSAAHAPSPLTLRPHPSVLRSPVPHIPMHGGRPEARRTSDGWAVGNRQRRGGFDPAREGFDPGRGRGWGQGKGSKRGRERRNPPLAQSHEGSSSASTEVALGRRLARTPRYEQRTFGARREDVERLLDGPVRPTTRQTRRDRRSGSSEASATAPEGRGAHRGRGEGRMMVWWAKL